MSNETALTKARALLQQVDGARATLESEREALMEQVREIDLTLARMPKPNATETPPQSREGRTALVPGRVTARKKMTVPEIVLEAIREKPGALSSEIIAAVKLARPKVQARDVFSVIYRLKTKRMAVRVEGQRGEQRHYLNEGVSQAAE